MLMPGDLTPRQRIEIEHRLDDLASAAHHPRTGFAPKYMWPRVAWYDAGEAFEADYYSDASEPGWFVHWESKDGMETTSPRGPYPSPFVAIDEELAWWGR